MRPDFSNVDFKKIPDNQEDFRQWEKEHNISADWMTAEQIPVKQVYGADDLAGMEHLNYTAGIPPYLRGPYSMMYAFRPWTIRQYAGFSTAEESNAFYRRNLAAGNDFEHMHYRRCEDFYGPGTAVTQIAWDPDMAYGKGEIALIRWPMAEMTVSTGRTTNWPSTGIGLLLPLASGAPSSMTCSLISFT